MGLLALAACMTGTPPTGAGAPRVPPPGEAPCIPVERTLLDETFLGGGQADFTGVDGEGVPFTLAPDLVEELGIGVDRDAAPAPPEGEPVGEEPPDCCPPAPAGWTLTYYLRPNETLSIKPKLARCAYRRDADDNDAIVALLDSATKAVTEVERVIGTRQDVTKTLIVTGEGTEERSCPACHTTTLPEGTPGSHYIFLGSRFEQVIARFEQQSPNPVRVVINTGRGADLNPRPKGLRNNLAPYHRR